MMFYDDLSNKIFSRGVKLAILKLLLASFSKRVLVSIVHSRDFIHMQYHMQM